MPKISDARILMIATDGFEESELFEPRRRLLDAGAQITLASLETREIQGEKGGEPGKTIKPDLAIESVDSKDYDALLLPGGVANPDKLRMNEQVVYTVKKFVDAGKPVGAICHAPWLLVEADVVRGRTATGWPSIRTDLRNAGANVVDKEAVTDGTIVTSRNPDDIPAFTDAFIALVENVELPLEAV
ncbi:MAG TPA: type 1 glutamine amidotransferase domain-containing protein [Allosphingosinicella sp.]|nr:type 1 glutamine amidotransferase domain-containing protein [Allosphingosinicella sp.]